MGKAPKRQDFWVSDWKGQNSGSFTVRPGASRGGPDVVDACWFCEGYWEDTARRDRAGWAATQGLEITSKVAGGRMGMDALDRYIVQRAARSAQFRTEFEALEGEYRVIDELIELRKRSGLTQKELAERLGTKQSAISRIERGKENLSLPFIRRFARACGATVQISFEVNQKERELQFAR
jgi:DNA-binding XRE family transcriptional regulator